MPKVKVNDIEIYYEIHGDGFPLVMIMGLSANIDWWELPLIEELSKQFKVIIFDNRGAGRTDKPAMDFSIKMFADDTVGLMNAYCLTMDMLAKQGSIPQEDTEEIKAVLIRRLPEIVERIERELNK